MSEASIRSSWTSAAAWNSSSALAAAKDLGVDVKHLVGNASLVRKIDPQRYLGPDLGNMTLQDILAELEKPSRDPRGDFTAPSYREDLQKLEDVILTRARDLRRSALEG